jgi:hypothetical protein
VKLRQFIKLLEQTPRDWYLDDGKIRRSDAHPGRLFGCQCPISAIRDEPTYHTSKVVNTIGLSAKRSGLIIDAADNSFCRHAKRQRVANFRRLLLAATGLNEP